MPVSVRLETLKIKAELASKLAQTWHYSRSSFDDSQGQTVPDHMEVVVIENERLTVTVAPMLGGRILGIIDRVTGAVAFEPRESSIQNGIGVLVECSLIEPLSSPVAYQLREADESDEPAGIILFGLVDGTNASWQGSIALYPGSATVDLRFQFVSRNYDSSEAEFGLAISSSSPFDGISYGMTWPSQRTTLHVSAEPGVFISASTDESPARFERLVSSLPFGSRQIDSWSAKLVLFEGLSALLACSEAAAVGFDGEEFVVAVREPIVNGKLVLALENGRTLESPLTAYPERTARFSVADIDEMIQGAAVIDGNGKIVMKCDQFGVAEGLSIQSHPLEFSGPLDQALNEFRAGRDPSKYVNFTSRFSGSKQACYELLGDFAMTQNDFAASIDHYDRALAYGAEDAILWWKKAYAMRRAGHETEDRDELANAHFLSPLEPLLRAEAFLSQPLSGEAGPNPLVAPLAMFPDQMTLVANHLLELGQSQDAARWIDECLRHREIPMLRILWAAMLLANGAKAEAYAQAQLALADIDAPIESGRWKESAAINALHKAFPELPNFDGQVEND